MAIALASGLFEFPADVSPPVLAGLPAEGGGPIAIGLSGVENKIVNSNAASPLPYH
jgi:hypothetical protein